MHEKKIKFQVQVFLVLLCWKLNSILNNCTVNFDSEINELKTGERVLGYSVDVEKTPRDFTIKITKFA